MKRIIWSALVAAAVILAAFTFSSAAAEGGVFVVPVKGDIDDGTYMYIKRALKEAKEEGVAALILDIDTYGGLVDASNKIRDEILESSVKTIAFVNQKAWSAGALIAISCTELRMQSSSSIGAAETRPAEEKYISAYRQQFESTAEVRGKDPDVAGAMVDSDIEVDGISEKGKILTLGAADAERIGFADGVHMSLDELIAATGLEGMERIDFKMNNSERLGQFLTSPVASELLLVLGVVGLIVEAFMPGFGIFGGIGVVSFALFFYGRLITGMAGFEIVVLFVAGLALLITELFIPGFGVLGVAGLIGIFASFVMSYPTAREALISVSIALAFAIATIIILVRTLEKRGIKGNSLFGRLILTEVTGRQVLPDKPSHKGSKGPSIGDIGIVHSTLRPVGTAYFGDSKVDVMSDGEFIEPGTKVYIVRVEGAKVMVRKADSDGGPAEEV